MAKGATQTTKQAPSTKGTHRKFALCPACGERHEMIWTQFVGGRNEWRYICTGCNAQHTGKVISG